MAPSKNGNQQKRHPIIPFENNGTSQKWHTTNTPSEIDKYGTYKKLHFRKMTLYKMAQLAKKRCLQVICRGSSEF